MSPIAKLAEARLKGPKYPAHADLPADLIFVGTFETGTAFSCDVYWDRSKGRIYDQWGTGYSLANQSVYERYSAVYRCMAFIKKLEKCLRSQNSQKLD